MSYECDALWKPVEPGQSTPFAFCGGYAREAADAQWQPVLSVACLPKEPKIPDKISSMIERIMESFVFFIIDKLWRFNMIDMYVALIIAGRRNITKVHERYRADVLEDLNALGLDGYGKRLDTEE